MGRINNWRRTDHESNLENEAVQEAVEEKGEAVIAAWSHPEINTRLVHVYEPAADLPFRVKLKDEDVELEEEGRYETRDDGGTANKDLMRRYP